MAPKAAQRAPHDSRRIAPRPAFYGPAPGVSAIPSSSTTAASTAAKTTQPLGGSGSTTAVPTPSINQVNALASQDMDLQKLSLGDMVTIKVRSGASDTPRSFYVVRECLRSKSSYFKAAFEGGFAESKSGVIGLDDVRPWVFASFVHWVYTDRLSLVGEKCDEMKEANDPRDPTTWPYSVLLRLYIFADKYDTRNLRMLIFEHIQVSIMKKGGIVPSRLDIATVYKDLPASTSLRRLMVESWIICEDERTEKAIAEYAENLPPRFLADFAARSMRRMQALHCYNCGGRNRNGGPPCNSKTHSLRDATDLYQRDWCELHEHNSKEEKDLCKLKRKAMDDKFEKPTN